jgi:hypothetical protein
MRCTQMVGLPKEAYDFLKDNAKLNEYCEYCHRSSGYVRKEIGVTGMFSEEKLFEYQLKDGKVAKECVQSSRWSSGPMIWLELRVSDGRVFSWAQKDIREANEEVDNFVPEEG